MTPSDDAPSPTRSAATGSGLAQRYRAVRAASLALAAPLSAEDQQVQAMADASPTKWHLAHTAWFFETFLLPHGPPFARDYGFLFNSYYEAVGERQPRAARGLLTRPSLAQVLAFRAHVDAAMERLMARGLSPAQEDLLRLGLAHEEQHQELILMDILALFAAQPLRPAYRPDAPCAPAALAAARFVTFAGGEVEIGHAGAGFSFDNERPRHRALIAPFAFSSRLVTNGEWLEFMAQGGYRRPELWHSDGWARVRSERWEAPAYWRRDGEVWRVTTLAGEVPVDPDAPVAHVSWYEAAAFAAFAGARLPTEAEWEHAAASALAGELEQMSESLWQWTASAYAAYPGFHAAEGAVGEYNGKFMVGQMTLRGGSFATPAGHARPTYRNFFYPPQRWMFAGLRLALDSGEPEGLEAFRADVRRGLGAPRKSLPPKWFYDARGSALFEQISALPEYYLTRQESSLLEAGAPEIAAQIPPGAQLVELGSGASRKTRLLLDAASQIASYAPVDISASALAAATQSLARDYPDLVVTPILADFATAQELPAARTAGPPVGFFPGSTIGNFAPVEAVDLLARLAGWLGEGARLVIGVDVERDPAILLPAYDDAAGVTAAFNRNILVRIDRELGGDLDPEAFDHLAIWNEPEGRVEMHLRARSAHRVRAAGLEIEFTEGETIHTENSYKPTAEGFAQLARRAGWRILTSWISPPPRFAVFLLRA